MPHSYDTVPLSFAMKLPSFVFVGAFLWASLCAAAEEPLTVAIDIGHSVKKPGAVSARGRGEFYFNQEIARKVAPALKAAGFGAFLINEDGSNTGLASRTKEAQRRGADLFLSIHHDAVNNKYYSKWEHEAKTRGYSDKFRGYSVFFSKRNPHPRDSRRFAALLGAEMKAAGFEPTHHHAEPIKGENRPLLDPEIGLYEFTDLIVLKTSRLPAALLECGVIVHRDEELDMRDPAVQQRIVDAVVRAVKAYANGPKVVAE